MEQQETEDKLGLLLESTDPLNWLIALEIVKGLEIEEPGLYLSNRLYEQTLMNWTIDCQLNNLHLVYDFMEKECKCQIDFHYVDAVAPSLVHKISYIDESVK